MFPPNPTTCKYQGSHFKSLIPWKCNQILDETLGGWNKWHQTHMKNISWNKWPNFHQFQQNPNLWGIKIKFMDIQHSKLQLKWKYSNYSSILFNNKIFLQKGVAFSNGPWATFQNNYHPFLPSKQFGSKYNKLYSSTINLTFINDKYIPSTFKYLPFHEK